MYQLGGGVARRDFHLAKRYYDLAYATSSEAQIPAQIGLFALWLHMLISEFTSGLEETEENDLKSMLSIPFTAVLEIVAVDTLLILVLLSLLVYILRRRWRPLPRSRANTETSGSGGARTPPNEGLDLFPNETNLQASLNSRERTASEEHHTPSLNGLDIQISQNEATEAPAEENSSAHSSSRNVDTISGEPTTHEYSNTESLERKDQVSGAGPSLQTSSEADSSQKDNSNSSCGDGSSRSVENPQTLKQISTVTTEISSESKEAEEETNIEPDETSNKETPGVSNIPHVNESDSNRIKEDSESNNDPI
mmetsp:Transcript_16252/g.21141  ORF Transcript_16252/g.21141 Transcript_16252/m.21141 type:complete len:309 (-) Transcript_16252:96-1022(-)